MDLITKKSQQSDALSDEVAKFLADGGTINKMRPCSAKESAYRSQRPYQRIKNGKKYLSRRYNKYQPQGDAFGGHSTK